jgi:PKD repeat protein
VFEAKEDSMRTMKCSASIRVRAALAGMFVLALFATAANAATRTVEVGPGGSMTFRDEESHNSTSTINVGDTINWTFEGFHSTTSGSCNPGCSPDGNWNSGTMSSGSFSHTFTTAGTFPYYCMVHLSAMTGSVVVQGTSGPPAASFTFAPPGTPVMGTTVTFTDTSTGTPTSWSWNFGDPASGTSNTSTVQNPTHVFASAGTYTVSLQATNAGGSNTAQQAITISAGGGVPCRADAETLCLNGGRFSVTAEWTKLDQSNGFGQAVPLTDDSGYFWFFDASNIEMVLKVLNGCAIDNAYWVFAAGLTNVQVDLTVTDTTTGAVYTNRNPQGTAFVPIQSTNAFPSSCP